MSDHGITLGELAVRFGCTLKGDPALTVRRVASLETASSDAVSFLANAKYKSFLKQTQAGVVVLDVASADECTVPALIDPTAHIDVSAHIGAHVVIGAEVVIGARVVIDPGCVLGERSTVGADTRLMANVTVCDESVIGQRCIINPNAVIGSEGFGFAPDSARGWVKVPQVGKVRIGNDVEVGASTTIDRGAIEDTVIEDGVKLDNQIQIAHNVHIGAHTAIAACVGISGSTTIGKHCMIAGQVGIAGHLTICDNVVITGKSLVSASIRKPGVYSGSLHVEEASKFRRNAARFAKLDELAKTVRRLYLRQDMSDKEDDKIDD